MLVFGLLRLGSVMLPPDPIQAGASSFLQGPACSDSLLPAYGMCWLEPSLSSIRPLASRTHTVIACMVVFRPTNASVWHGLTGPPSSGVRLLSPRAAILYSQPLSGGVDAACMRHVLIWLSLACIRLRTHGTVDVSSRPYQSRLHDITCRASSLREFPTSLGLAASRPIYAYAQSVLNGIHLPCLWGNVL